MYIFNCMVFMCSVCPTSIELLNDPQGYYPVLSLPLSTLDTNLFTTLLHGLLNERIYVTTSTYDLWMHKHSYWDNLRRLTFFLSSQHGEEI